MTTRRPGWGGLAETDSEPVFIPGAGDANGNVLYLRGDTLMARPFDDRRLQFTGEPERLADSVGTIGAFLGLFSASTNGILVTGQGGNGNRNLGWYDRQGKLLSQVGDQANGEMELRSSPDGTRVVEGRLDGQGIWAVWELDVARGTSTRFTFEPTGAGNGVWSADGTQIAYASGGGQSAEIYRKVANGATKEEVLYRSDIPMTPLDWSPDGKWLLYNVRGKDTGADLWALPDASGPAGAERKPIPYLVTPFNEAQSKFSPDGKWVAYDSNESGAVEVYVRPFPASSEREVAHS